MSRKPNFSKSASSSGLTSATNNNNSNNNVNNNNNNNNININNNNNNNNNNNTIDTSNLASSSNRSFGSSYSGRNISSLNNHNNYGIFRSNDEQQQYRSSQSSTTTTTNKTETTSSSSTTTISTSKSTSSTSNRSQFLESYYSNKTRIPSAANDPSSFNNIITPLNSLHECDAITQRLLSSPKKFTGIVDNRNFNSPNHKSNQEEANTNTYDSNDCSRDCNDNTATTTTDGKQKNTNNNMQSHDQIVSTTEPTIRRQSLLAKENRNNNKLITDQLSSPNLFRSFEVHSNKYAPNSGLDRTDNLIIDDDNEDHDAEHIKPDCLQTNVDNLDEPGVDRQKDKLANEHKIGASDNCDDQVTDGNTIVGSDSATREATKDLQDLSLDEQRLEQDGLVTKKVGSHQQQLAPQLRSLSVCHDDHKLDTRLNKTFHGHGLANLSRAISLACEPSSTSSTSKSSLVAKCKLTNIIPLFGCDIRSLEQCIKFGSILPPIINSIVEHIICHGINSVGIFRKSGVKSRILALKQKIETNQDTNFQELNKNNEFSIYDIADLVKMWFRELKPVPLLTKDLIRLISSSITTISDHEQSTSATTLSSLIITQPTTSFSPSFNGPKNEDQRADVSPSMIAKSASSSSSMKNMRSLISGPNVHGNLINRMNSLLTNTHKTLLARALDFLSKISSRSEFNQMTSQNLAICLTPSLCATDSNQKSILAAQRVLEFCIDNHSSLFGDHSSRVEN